VNGRRRVFAAALFLKVQPGGAASRARRGEASRMQQVNRRADAATDRALSPAERKRVEERSAPRAVVVHEVVRREGEKEMERPVSALLWSGLAAGLSMGFSMVAEGLLQSGLPEAPWRHLVSSFGYALGFLIVILGRQQLFTESTLTAVLPVLYRRDLASLGGLMRVWSAVFAANIAGTFLFALLVAKGNAFPPDAHAAFLELGRHALEGGFASTLLRAVFAGWLIALMVWLLPTAGSARPLIIVILTYMVALGRLSHVIAGSAEAFYAVLAGGAPYADYVLKFLLPTLIGNVIGGVSLVALVNHAQVAAELAATGDADEG
jgi:formate-nitrite transporter family protein